MALKPTSPQSRPAPSALGGDQQQAVFVREVDDAVRQDVLLESARRYGKIAAGVVVAALAALAGYLWYAGHNTSVADGQAEAFTKALDEVESGNLGPAKVELLAISGGKAAPAYQAAARAMEAAVAQAESRPDDAARQFQALADDKAAPQVYRDLATIRLVTLQFDKLAPDAVVTRLKPLAQPGKPWFPSAGELSGLALLKLGRNAEAGAMFAAVANAKDAPVTLRSRTRQLAALLGVAAGEDLSGPPAN